jgi:ATP-dependent 26S proteasome regulatory subunit
MQLCPAQQRAFDQVRGVLPLFDILGVTGWPGSGLTLLDGLESATAGRVCVMMTAMDIAHLPPALVRSGRIELWLEMRLPDEGARAEILSANLAPAAAAVGPVDVERLAGEADGFTGADLKRLVEDGKNLLAADRAQGKAVAPATDYFLRALEAVRDNKARYAEADARAARCTSTTRQGCSEEGGRMKDEQRQA